MDPELRTYLDETRRHFHVVAERMGSQLQLVAEGVSSLSERLDRAEQNLREETLRAGMTEAPLPPVGGEGGWREVSIEERIRRLEAER